MVILFATGLSLPVLNHIVRAFALSLAVLLNPYPTWTGLVIIIRRASHALIPRRKDPRRGGIVGNDVRIGAGLAARPESANNYADGQSSMDCGE
jgi:hypothetical protein